VTRVFLTKEARSHFESLPASLQGAVDNALTEIEVDPEAAGKQLLGRLSGLWSTRVGNYRILYTIESKGRSPRVIVRAIRHRAVAYERKGRRS
jgi:mRNA-degrading endonuclease RelE of RelBE toxin-antitoxin system